jgi:hypothetical protein
MTYTIVIGYHAAVIKEAIEGSAMVCNLKECIPSSNTTLIEANLKVC